VRKARPRVAALREAGAAIDRVVTIAVPGGCAPAEPSSEGPRRTRRLEITSEGQLADRTS